MKKVLILIILFASTIIFVTNTYAAAKKEKVCKNIGELVHGDQSKCKKGDVIMVNPMLAGYLCDLTKSIIPDAKIVVCYYIGYKRLDRK